MQADFQGKCDKLAGMIKEENKAEDVECDAAIYVVPKPLGCKCNSIGPGQKGCALQDKKAISPGGVTKELRDMGFTLVTNEAKVASGNFLGSLVAITCFYWEYDGVLSQYPDVNQRALQSMSDQVTGILKQAEGMSIDFSRGMIAGMWALTLPPGDHDKYGTPRCGGFCTTMDMVYWNAWTQAPPAAKFL